MEGKILNSKMEHNNNQIFEGPLMVTTHKTLRDAVMLRDTNREMTLVQPGKEVFSHLMISIFTARRTRDLTWVLSSPIWPPFCLLSLTAS